MKPADRRSRRTNLTGRAAILAVVVCAIVLSLAYPLREYLGQRHRIAELRAENQQLQQDIAALEKRKRQLDDPDHIKRLARERLHFRMPGETVYIVADGREDVAEEGPGTTGEQGGQRPWFVNLWRSVEKVDEGKQR